MIIKEIKEFFRYIRSKEYRERKNLLKWFMKNFPKKTFLIGYEKFRLTTNNDYIVTPLWIKGQILRGKFTDFSLKPIIFNSEFSINLAKTVQNKELIRLKNYLVKKLYLNP